MLTRTQHQRIARKSCRAISQALDKMPDYLRLADPDKAAAVVADLIKAVLATPVPDSDPGEGLARIIRAAREAADYESDDPPTGFTPDSLLP